MSRGEEKVAQLVTSVKALLETGESVRAVIDKFAAALYQNGCLKEAELILAVGSNLWGEPSDAEGIAAWLDAQAAKERELLDSDRMRADAHERTQERWMVYKASAQAVREGAWKKP